MSKDLLRYERPTIADHGSLTEITAMIQVGGPVDTFEFHPPGHSCPTGPPLSGGTGTGDPECNGVGSEPNYP